MNLLTRKGLVFRSRFHATTYYVCFLYVFTTTTSVCHDGEAVAPENDAGTRNSAFVTSTSMIKRRSRPQPRVREKSPDTEGLTSAHISDDEGDDDEANSLPCVLR